MLSLHDVQIWQPEASDPTRQLERRGWDGALAAGVTSFRHCYYMILVLIIPDFGREHLHETILGAKKSVKHRFSISRNRLLLAGYRRSHGFVRGTANSPCASVWKPRNPLYPQFFYGRCTGESRADQASNWRATDFRQNHVVLRGRAPFSGLQTWWVTPRPFLIPSAGMLGTGLWSNEQKGSSGKPCARQNLFLWPNHCHGGPVGICGVL